MTNYAAGWNMGGYSPDPDNVWVTDSFESAVTYLADTVDRWWDSDYDLDDDPADIDGRYLTAHSELHNVGTVPRDIDVVVQDPNGYDHHLWIMATDQEVTDE